jgi:hypothetical protein
MRTRHVLIVAATMLLAVGGWSLPTLASGGVTPLAQVCTSNYSACSYDYAVNVYGIWYGWAGVAIQDNACDSAGVYTKYYRDSGGEQGHNNYQGCHTEARTGADTGNLIRRHKACTNYTGPDLCSSWIWR